MQTHKQDMLYGTIHNQQFISGKLGIVADPPGSGKTLSVLAFVAAELAQVSPLPRLPIGDLHPQSNRLFSSHIVPSSTDVSNVNVIVVPYTLIHQWQDEIKLHTRLVPFVIQNRRILRNKGTSQAILQSHFILTTNRMYREVHDYCKEHSINWKNLFFDEAASMYLSPNDPVPNASFFWFITGQWQHMLFKNMHALLPQEGDFHPDFLAWAKPYGTSLFCSTDASAFYKSLLPWTHPERSCLVLRNVFQKPLSYPSITYHTVECRTQYTLANLPLSVLGTNYSGLTHEAIPNIFAALGLGSWSLQRIKQIHGHAEQIDNNKDNDCVICLDKPQNTVLVPCCMNMFCGACILRQLIMHGECPTCRALLVLPCLLPITEVIIPFRHTKQESCIHYIMNNPQISIIVYTLYENTFYQIQPILAEQGIVAECLDMPLTRFHKTISHFRSGETRILFVSNLELIKGLDLSKADALILFYEIPVYERMQTLVHSMVRLGSQSQKMVVHLKSTLD